MVKRSYDTIRVYVPMGVTADLGVAMKRCRERRIMKLKQKYPSLFPEKKGSDDENSEFEKEKGKEKKSDDMSSSKKSVKRHFNSEPQREDYGSMLDYIEAKYAKGVVPTDPEDKKRQRMSLGGDKEDGNLSDSSEDAAGSTYSGGSGFIDDSELLENVAEQVMANSRGTTKIEAAAMKGKDDMDAYLKDDAAFFINVGPLEMEAGFEDNDTKKIDFSALGKEKPVLKVKKKKKKKAVPTPSTNEKKESASKSSKVSSSTLKSGTNTPPPPKKQKLIVSSTTSSSTPKPASTVKSSSTSKAVKVASQPKPIPTSAIKEEPVLSVAAKALQQKAMLLKKEKERLYKLVLEQTHALTEEHLPRLVNETVKVWIRIPAGKNPGDDIAFNNPRVKGQRLRVKVPENGVAGEKFIVSVPVPSKPSLVDENKFPREFRDVLDEFSRAYDDYIDAEAKFHEAKPATGSKSDQYKPNNEKMKKFDKLISEFPTNLATPIDAPYLRKVVRKARQNSMKRKMTLDKKKTDSKNGDAKEEKDGKCASGSVGKSAKKGPIFPRKSTTFPEYMFNKRDFDRV